MKKSKKLKDMTNEELQREYKEYRNMFDLGRIFLFSILVVFLGKFSILYFTTKIPPELTEISMFASIAVMITIITLCTFFPMLAIKMELRIREATEKLKEELKNETF